MVEVSYDGMLLRQAMASSNHSNVCPKMFFPFLIFHCQRLCSFGTSLMLLLVASKRCKTAPISTSAQYRPVGCRAKTTVLVS